MVFFFFFHYLNPGVTLIRLVSTGIGANDNCAMQNMKGAKIMAEVQNITTKILFTLFKLKSVEALKRVAINVANTSNKINAYFATNHCILSKIYNLP